MSQCQEFNHICFAVPGRRFAIDSFVTEQDRLPIVIEFALRLVKLLSEVTIDELQAFFGFTSRETEALLHALEAQRLIAMEDDRLTLSPYALSRFEESTDELPRFTSVEPRSDVVDFELLAYSPVRGTDAPPYLRNFVEIELAEGESVGRSNRLAEEAFQEKFSGVARLKGWRGAEKLDVYKVTRVEAKKNFFVPIPMHVRLDDENGYVRDPERDSPETPEQFWTEISQRIPSLMPRQDGGQRKHLQAFSDAFSDKVIRQFLNLSGFDFSAYLKGTALDKTIGYGADTEPMFGNFYLPDNRRKIEEWLRLAYGREGGQPRLWSPMIWYAPNYSWWGRTGLVEDACRDFASILWGTKAGERLALAVQAERDEKQATENQYRGTSIDEVHLFEPDTVFGGRVEVLFVPTRLACVLFHLSIPKAPAVWAPVGFLTTNELRIEATRRFLAQVMAADRYLSRLERKIERASLVPRSSDLANCLNYVAVVETATGLQPLTAA